MDRRKHDDLEASRIAALAVTGQIPQCDALGRLAVLVENSPSVTAAVRSMTTAAGSQPAADAERRFRDTLVESCLRGALFNLPALAAGASMSAYLYTVCRRARRLMSDGAPPVPDHPHGMDAAAGSWLGDLSRDMSHRMPEAVRADVGVRALAALHDVRRLHVPAGQNARMACFRACQDAPALAATARMVAGGGDWGQAGPCGPALAFHSPVEAGSVAGLDTSTLRALAHGLAKPLPGATKEAARLTVRHSGELGPARLAHRTAHAWLEWQTGRGPDGQEKPARLGAEDLDAFLDAAGDLCRVTDFDAPAQVDDALNGVYLRSVSEIQAWRTDRKLGVQKT